MRKEHPSGIAVPFMAMVGCNVLWGISFPLMAIINRLVTGQQLAVGAPLGLSQAAALSLTLAAFYLVIRFLCALAMLRVLLPSTVRDITPNEWRRGLWVGLFSGLGMVLQVVGLGEIPASRSGFLTSLSVVITPLLMVAIERRFPRPFVVLGCIVACAGTAVLCGLFDPRSGSFAFDGVLMTGDVLTIIASALFGVAIIVIDRSSQGIKAEHLTAGMLLGVALVSVPVLICCISALPEPATQLLAWGRFILQPSFLGLTLAMSLICTVVPFFWMNKYQHYFSPAHASLIYTLEPIFATLWALFIPGLLAPIFGVDYASERPGFELICGGGLILLGNVFALAKLPKRRLKRTAGSLTESEG